MEEWKTIFSRKKERYEWIFTILFLIFIVAVHPFFLNYIETRPAEIFIEDVLLKNLFSYDLSSFIFLLLYISVIIFLFRHIKSPSFFLHSIQLYSLVQLFRILTLFLTPLSTPDGCILLRDPFVEATFYQGSVYTRDLFFSGHVATMCCLFWLEINRKWKMFFLFASIVMSACILIQHIHYTIDVVGAWFFSFVAFTVLNYIKNLDWNKSYEFSIFK